MKKKTLKIYSKKIVPIVIGFFVLSLFFVIFFKINKVEGNIKEIGDYVYSDEVKIKTGEGDDDFDTIEGYSGFDWNGIKKIMDANEKRLLDEYAVDMSDPSFSWNNINPGNKPEGQVWKTNGNLNINSNISVGGKGTIIIEEGDLNINADISYISDSSKNSIGFIVSNGSVNISKDVKNLVGAYYASNEIDFYYDK